jgi:predicted dehydrogenase
MDEETAIIGFIGAGGIARSHAYSLNSLKFYYNDIPGIELAEVCAGTGDDLSLELYTEKGALRYSSTTPDYFEFYTEDSGLWSKMMTGSNYKPVTSFPSGHVPPGWLRAMVHAHYVFLTGGSSELFIPDIEHGLEVQRLVRETAEHLEKFRFSIILHR